MIDEGLSYFGQKKPDPPASTSGFQPLTFFKQNQDTSIFSAPPI